MNKFQSVRAEVIPELSKKLPQSFHLKNHFIEELEIIVNNLNFSFSALLRA